MTSWVVRRLIDFPWRDYHRMLVAAMVGDTDARIFTHLRQLDANKWNIECRIASHRQRHTYIWNILKWILRRNGKWKWWWLCSKEFGTIFFRFFFLLYAATNRWCVNSMRFFLLLILFALVIHSVRYASAMSQKEREKKRIGRRKETEMMTWERKRIQQKWNNISNRIEWFTVIERKEDRKNGKRKIEERKATAEHKSMECNCDSLAIHLVSFSFYSIAENIFLSLCV